MHQDPRLFEASLHPLSSRGVSRKSETMEERTPNPAEEVSLQWLDIPEIFLGSIDDQPSNEDQVRQELLSHPVEELKSLSEEELLLPRRDPDLAFLEDTPEPESDCVTTNFKWRDIPVQVDMFYHMDASQEDPHEHSIIGSDVRSAIQQCMPKRPDKELVQYLTAKARLESGTDDKRSWRSIRLAVLRELWNNPASWAALEAECRARREDPEIQKMLKSVKKSYRYWDPWWQAHQDRVAGEGPDILRKLPEGTIYIAVDKHGAVLLFVFPRGLTFTYDEATTQHIFDDLATYARHEPPPKPDVRRHPLDEDWIKEHPEFSSEQGGYHGTYHWGCHHEVDHETVTFVVETGDTRLLNRNTHIARLNKELMTGACGVLTRALYFWFGVLDPDLRARCQKVVEHTPTCLRTTEKECFSMRAALLNVKTESHKDSRDWKSGLAFLTPGGEFQGADLCVIDLGIQVPFPPGSIAAIRGREFEHFTTAWTGVRTCIVHTNHQSVREEAEERMAEPKGQQGLAKRLRVEAAARQAAARRAAKLQGQSEAGSSGSQPAETTSSGKRKRSS